MAISQLTLYKNCKIVPERRIKVERLEDYLAGLQNIYINNFQYIKHSLNLEIKIDRNQTGLLIKQSENYNYIKIRNVITGVDYDDYYYFIISKKWIAQDTLKLVLKMDTINTFYDKMTFNAKTQILREHKTSHVKSGQYIYPVLDFNSEGLFPQLYNSKSGYYANKEIREDSSNQSWYLVYKNLEDPTDENVNSNPVECYLYTDGNLSIGGYSSGYSSQAITWTSNTDSYNHMFFYDDNGSQTINLRFRDTRDQTLANISYTLGNNYDFSGHVGTIAGVSFTNSQLFGIFFTTYNSLTRPVIHVIIRGDNGKLYELNYEYVPAEAVYWPCVYSDIRATYGRLWKYSAPYGDTTWFQTNDFRILQLVYWSNNYSSFIIPSIENVDRTDSRLIKIIKLPYCPDDTILRDHENLTSKWYIDRNYFIGVDYAMLKLYNPTKKLQSTFTPLDSSNNPIKPFEFLKPMAYPPQYWEQYSVDDEPKMFHSEFFCVKLVYDSFVLNLPAEALGVDGNEPAIADNFSLTFTPTTTINSRFMWKVNNYTTKYGSENFDSVLVVSRNNELPIFTNAYLNYIRTGYNYDIKSKTTREASVWAGLGLSVLGGALAGSYAGGVGAVAGAVVGAVGGLVGAITSTIQTENTFNKNLQSLEWQTTSVRDSNDVDLMTEYCGNRLQVFYYIASPKVRQQVERLFYYYGYKSERVGLPNPNIRIGWDFLQCQAEFNKNEWNVPEEYIMDLKTQLEAGTTFIHYIAEPNQEDNSHWDIDQQYANYEKSIM